MQFGGGCYIPLMEMTQRLTPHKIKPGGSSSMTLKQKHKNILAVDRQSG
jgi:hypothetical protein